MVNPRTTVEAGMERVSVFARLADYAERERIWADQVTLMPTFTEFEAAAGRQVPIVVLHRI